MLLLAHKQLTFLKVNKRNFINLTNFTQFWDFSYPKWVLNYEIEVPHSRKFCNANYHPVACKLINFADVCESPRSKVGEQFSNWGLGKQSTWLKREGRRRNIKPSCGNTLVSISPAVSQHSRIASNCEQWRCRLRIPPDVLYWKRGQNITRVEHSVGRRVMLWSWTIDCFAAD